MDVNGLAASIELYLGEDVLRQDGQLVPVQWKGFNPILKQYQGEILEKDRIHKRFREKLSHLEDHPDFVNSGEWSGMRTVMEAIFSAFHTYDRDLIFAERLENYSR
jgi:hypothetical protein